MLGEQVNVVGVIHRQLFPSSNPSQLETPSNRRWYLGLYQGQLFLLQILVRWRHVTSAALILWPSPDHRVRKGCSLSSPVQPKLNIGWTSTAACMRCQHILVGNFATKADVISSPNSGYLCNCALAEQNFLSHSSCGHLPRSHTPGAPEKRNKAKFIRKYCLVSSEAAKQPVLSNVSLLCGVVWPPGHEGPWRGTWTTS